MPPEYPYIFLSLKFERRADDEMVFASLPKERKSVQTKGRDEKSRQMPKKISKSKSGNSNSDSKSGMVYIPSANAKAVKIPRSVAMNDNPHHDNAYQPNEKTDDIQISS